MNHRLFQIEIPVRWRDLDALNHVNNATYLGYVEEARVLWFKSLSDSWVNESASPILAAITMNYRRPVGWPETLGVELFAERTGNKSLTLGHRIHSAGNPEILYADGNAVMVWVDSDGKSVLLPEDIRTACSVE